MFNSNEPLWLPRGSVRAIITFSLLAAFVACVFSGIQSSHLEGLVAIVVGFYFGKRAVEGRNG